MNIFEIMAPAFVECLVLVGIHSYLGLHVIRRKVIFVDLALAQIAALGTTVGFLLGIMPETTGAYVFSLGFTVIGAAIFSLSRLRHEKIPQEAVIGLTYAIAASVAILVIDKAPHGAEHIKEIISGSILWVKWSTILSAAVVYSIIGVFHYIFRRQFILISEDPDSAYRQGMSVRFWDFLFYVSFGVVITHSVGTAGVLLVFVFLVVPAIASILLTNSWWKQLFIGWALGLFVSTLGLFVSYQMDLPSGPAIVAVYGITLLFIVIFLYVKKAASLRGALRNVTLGILVCIIAVWGFKILANVVTSAYHEHEHIGFISEEEHLLHEIKVHEKLNQMSEAELNKFLTDISDLKLLHDMFDAEDDGFIRFKIAERISVLDSYEGIHLFIDILEVCEIPFLREQVLQKLRVVSGQNFAFDPFKNPAENSDALQKWKNWLRKNQEKL